MTNLEWIKTKATTEQLAEMFDRMVCEKCAYNDRCDMTQLHYALLDCNTGIVEWLNSERIEK